TTEVRSPKAFLTTIVTRLCLNHLDLARVRLEHEDAPLLLENLSSRARSPAEHAEFTEELSEALRTVLGNLSPAERVVFLLREAFQLDYADVALGVDGSEELGRELWGRDRDGLIAGEASDTAVLGKTEGVVLNSHSVGAAVHLDQSGNVGGIGAPVPPSAADLSSPAPPLIHDREV